MAAKLTILFTDEILDALSKSKSITIRLEAARGAGPAPRSGPEEPRAGSLPARVIAWARTRKKPFRTADITKRFKLSRAHASMLLSRLASGSYPIERAQRGLYRHAR